MRYAFIALALQGYALLLAYCQMLRGVRTDEAKYLLDIPYPHPPLGRGIFHALEGFTHQELILRIVLASLLVQVVWLIYETAKKMQGHIYGLFLSVLWLLSAAVILQSGTIMMAPVTAVQGMVLVYVAALQREKGLVAGSWGLGGWIALFWLASLFTAYQTILYLPLVIAIFWRMQMPQWQKAAAISTPILLLVLYTATNPLVIASFISAGTQNVDSLSSREILQSVLRTWVVGGSLVLSFLGTFYALRNRSWPVLLSMVLVAMFIAVSHRPYYAILFTPLFVAELLQMDSPLWKPVALSTLQGVVTVALLLQGEFVFSESPARATLAAIAEQNRDGIVLIDGSFGHEWQYESSFPIRRYREHLRDTAQAIVCMEPCTNLGADWRQLTSVSTEVWVR